MSIGSRLSRTIVGLLSVAASGAWATEYGRVVSATPIVAAVPVPQRECIDRPVVYAQPNSGVGALIGAITGAAIASNVGGGTGRAAATGIGLIAGSVIGDRVEGSPAPVASTVRQCRTVTRYENRSVGYDVVYDYHGVRRHTQLARDPGDRIALDVSVAPAAVATPPVDDGPPAQGVYSPVPPQVIYADPTYAPRVVVNPWPVVSLGFDGGRDDPGWRGRDHRDGDGWRRDRD
jgi:uncharacterized protein YcfJ